MTVRNKLWVLRKLWNPWTPMYTDIPQWVVKLAWKKYRGKDDVVIHGKHYEYRAHWKKKKIGTYHSAHDGDGADFDMYVYVSPSFQRRYKI